MDIKELSGRANDMLANHKEFYAQEVDFSKFDKSQDDLSLNIFLKIMEKFGIPKSYIDFWKRCH